MIYLYDNSFDGLLCAIFQVYKDKNFDSEIFCEDFYDNTTFFLVVNIKTNSDISARVMNGIAKKLGYSFLTDIYYLYLSDNINSGNIALKYVIEGFKSGTYARDCLHLSHIKEANILANKVSFEAHRLKGLIRFKRYDENIYIADITPDHNILPLIATHFVTRFADQHFLIRDLKRSIAILYTNKKWQLIPLTERSSNPIEGSDQFEKMWKGYFKNIAIGERINPTLQKKCMPKRYWKHMTEFG